MLDRDQTRVDERKLGLASVVHRSDEDTEVSVMAVAVHVSVVEASSPEDGEDPFLWDGVIRRSVVLGLLLAGSGLSCPVDSQLIHARPGLPRRHGLQLDVNFLDLTDIVFLPLDS